jgi:hypothetical protein
MREKSKSENEVRMRAALAIGGFANGRFWRAAARQGRLWQRFAAW